jgi:hypothetical protein
MQAHRFGEYASNIETRQSCAFPGLRYRTGFASQHSGRATLANVIAAEALCGASRRAYIDFVSSRHKNILCLACAFISFFEGKKQNNKI